MKAMTENKMGTEPIRKLLITMSLPAMLSMLVQSLYNVVDSMFVAKINEDALTAVSLVYPIQILMIAVGIGTAIGVNSLISRRLGEKRFEEANHAAEHGIFLGVCNWIIFAIIGIFFSHSIMNAFTKDAAVANLGYSYLLIVTTGSVGILIESNISKTLQATGNMLYPMMSQLIGAITNIILNPLMIFGIGFFPKMGIVGSATATITGQMLSLIFSSYVLAKKQKEIKVTMRHFRPQLSIIKDIYVVGFPSIIMQAIMSVLVTCLNIMLIVFSKTAVAFLGIYYKLQSFIYMPVFGLSQGAMPILGYNFGARNKKRLLSTLKLYGLIAIIIMSVGVLLFHLFPKQLLIIFSASKQMFNIGIPALKTMSLCFVFSAVGITISTVFQAIGQGFKSMVLSLLRQLIFILPAAYLLAKYTGLGGIWYAFVIAELLTMCIAIPMLMFTLKKQFAIWKEAKQHADNNVLETSFQKK